MNVSGRDVNASGRDVNASGRDVKVSGRDIKTEKTLKTERKCIFLLPLNLSRGRNFGVSWCGDLGFVSLKTYDIFGKETAVLSNKKLSPGRYKSTFYPCDTRHGSN